MNLKEVTKTYTNGEVTILWQAALCQHSGVCVKNLHDVFKPQTQPWIQMENASSEAIVATVAKCPSGALTIVENK
jgi:uncharacterized Fe-S cluster protein YjdI